MHLDLFDDAEVHRQGNRRYVVTMLAVIMLVWPSSFVHSQDLAVEERMEPLENGYVDANGISYYYEIHGEGEPLLLLHGGLGSIDMFRPLLPALAATRQVIGVDLHGHGRTELGDRPRGYRT